MKKTGLKVMDVKVEDQAQRCKPRVHRANTGMKNPIDCRKWDRYLIPRVSIGAFRAALDGLVSPAVGKRTNQIRAFRARATANLTGPKMLGPREPVDASTGGERQFLQVPPRPQKKVRLASPESGHRLAGVLWSPVYTGFSLSPLPFSTFFRPLLYIIAVGRGGGDFLVPHSPLGLKLLQKHLKILA